MDKAWNAIKKRWEEDPLTVIMIGSVAASAAAALINSLSAAQGRRAYAKHASLRARGR